mmetsp:Transcript_27981/g.50544  ORF Transcript_27981/g.50544 Transcript_27981/m.50544 type:complete len:97 (-) Transcript_27981:433-723(-)
MEPFSKFTEPIRKSKEPFAQGCGNEVRDRGKSCITLPDSLPDSVHYCRVDVLERRFGEVDGSGSAEGHAEVRHCAGRVLCGCSAASAEFRVGPCVS